MLVWSRGASTRFWRAEWQMLMTTLDRKASRRETALRRTLLLQTILEESKRRRKKLKLAFIDVVKAFDSVTHKAPAEAALEAGIDIKMVRYILNNSKRQAQISGRRSNKMCKTGPRRTRGRPSLFCTVQSGHGPNTEEATCIHWSDGWRTTSQLLTYADDVVLLAVTKTGLQHLLDKYQKGLDISGLNTNVKKSSTLDLETVPKDRQLVVTVCSKFRCGPDSLPSMSGAGF